MVVQGKTYGATWITYEMCGEDLYLAAIKDMLNRNYPIMVSATSRIMTLHNDVSDIMYGCRCVYDEGKKHGLALPLFYGNMDRIFVEIKD